MTETFTHRGGQKFEKHLEFKTWIHESDKKLILAKSVYTLHKTPEFIMEDLEPHYFSAGHWFVLYGNLEDKEYNMGITRLAYPIATRALTLDSALWRFHKMVKNIDKVNFVKIKN